MKTTIRQFVAIAIFSFILAGNVNAKEHSLNASSLETIEETSLEMESWMTDASLWNTGGVPMMEAETTLRLENWMTDARVWNTNNTDFSEVEAESTLNIENWMTDQATWKVVPEVKTEIENRLVLENWMINKNTWKI